MDLLVGLPKRAFEKADPSPDLEFYAQPRLVTHIDAGAIAAVTALYRETVPAGGIVLDLMSSWISHLPRDVSYSEVIGHGMNASELAANPRLDRRFVQNLNDDQDLPLADGSVDATLVCVGVQYLQQPVAVFADVRRISRPGAPVIVTFSNRCFPTKAVAVWHVLDGPGHQRLVSLYLEQAGFSRIEGGGRTPPGADPLWWVIGYAGSVSSA